MFSKYTNWKTFNRYEAYIMVAFWVLYALTNSWVNAESVFSDYQRLNIGIAPWEPYLWELSSQFSMILYIPIILIFDKKYSLAGSRPLTSIVAHLSFSLVLSILHVVTMILIRVIVYQVMGKNYDFGNWFDEFIYEYRKDFFSYISILVTIYSYRFIISHLRAEGKAIQQGEDAPEHKFLNKLLIKKFGKTFMIEIKDVEWIEAAGNYMNLHMDGRVYSYRATMSALEKKLDPATFARIHRSQMVNLNFIKEIQPRNSGDSKIILQNGGELNLSRRFRSKFNLLFQ